MVGLVKVLRGVEKVDRMFVSVLLELLMNWLSVLL